jgi:hypothetical protein
LPPPLATLRRKALDLCSPSPQIGSGCPQATAGVARRARTCAASGRSTLVKLLCRFYDPTRGAILWDGVDLRELPPEQLRARIGAVFQDFVSYELSAAENIAVGDLPVASDPERIAAAAREAGVHDALAALPPWVPDDAHPRVRRRSARRCWAGGGVRRPGRAVLVSDVVEISVLDHVVGDHADVAAGIDHSMTGSWVSGW